MFSEKIGVKRSFFGRLRGTGQERNLFVHIIQIQMQQYGWRVNTWANTFFTDLAESQHALIVSGVAWINFNEKVCDLVDDACVYISEIKERCKQFL
jgi:hypothetical protein